MYIVYQAMNRDAYGQLLNIPDALYNSLIDFFQNHEHCTKYGKSISQMLQVLASIIQGSAIGPISYIINALDLSTVMPGNLVYKYADDAHLVIPASNVQSIEPNSTMLQSGHRQTI